MGTATAMPDFWLGMILLTIAGRGARAVPGRRDRGPLIGRDGPCQAHGPGEAHVRFRLLTLALAYLGEYALIMRSSLLDTMREDYLVLARAKGLRDVIVRNRHAVPNALLPVVALGAINFGLVLSGSHRRRGDLLVARARSRDLRGAEGP